MLKWLIVTIFDGQGLIFANLLKKKANGNCKLNNEKLPGITSKHFVNPFEMRLKKKADV